MTLYSFWICRKGAEVVREWLYALRPSSSKPSCDLGAFVRVRKLTSVYCFLCDFVSLCVNRCWKKITERGIAKGSKETHSFIIDLIEWPSTWLWLIHSHQQSVRIPFAPHLRSFFFTYHCTSGFEKCLCYIKLLKHSQSGIPPLFSTQLVSQL